MADVASVWLLVVKGNLRHRIELLGAEKPINDLTPPQRILRDAAMAQELADNDDTGPDRPSVAHGVSCT